jgi:hypothetical protein
MIACTVKGGAINKWRTRSNQRILHGTISMHKGCCRAPEFDASRARQCRVGGLHPWHNNFGLRLPAAAAGYPEAGWLALTSDGFFSFCCTGRLREPRAGHSGWTGPGVLSAWEHSASARPLSAWERSTPTAGQYRWAALHYGWVHGTFGFAVLQLCMEVSLAPPTSLGLGIR